MDNMPRPNVDIKIVPEADPNAPGEWIAGRVDQDVLDVLDSVDFSSAVEQVTHLAPPDHFIVNIQVYHEEQS